MLTCGSLCNNYDVVCIVDSLVLDDQSHHKMDSLLFQLYFMIFYLKGTKVLTLLGVSYTHVIHVCGTIIRIMRMRTANEISTEILKSSLKS